MKLSEVVLLMVVVLGGCISQSGTPSLKPSPFKSSDLKSLEGLPVDEFFDKSYEILLTRNPEFITELGISQTYGGNDRLTDISDSYIRETYELASGILDLLREYDRNSLTPEQKISYDMYEWYLDDLVRQQEFIYYDYPVTFFITGVQNQMTQFFTDIHPIASKEDAEDYIARLSQVDTKFDQLLEGLKLREEAGIIPPRFMVQWSLSGVNTIARGTARYLPFYTAFEEKVNGLEGLNAEEKQVLLTACESEVNESVIPAYKALKEYLEHLESIASTKDGVWQFPEGDDYYAYVLRHHTTTDMTAEEIHELGLREVERIHAEMRALFDELGYPQDESLSELFSRVAREQGYVDGNQVLARYEALIQQASQNLDAAFDIHPRTEVMVVGFPAGSAYYVPGSIDGSRPGVFYAPVTSAGEPLYGMPTLAYHEAVPGHHFQLSIARELDLPLFRKAISFTAFEEGWALYAERLAWELGWYENDPYGNLGRLQAEAFRAARLVVDTGIHAKGWTFDQALQYMDENVGYDPSVTNLRFEVGRYIAWPGQAASYKIGMMNLLELRQKAKDALGDRFDLKEFHRVILSHGDMPLEVLEKVVQDYIDTSLGKTTYLKGIPHIKFAMTQSILILEFGEIQVMKPSHILLFT